MNLGKMQDIFFIGIIFILLVLIGLQVISLTKREEEQVDNEYVIDDSYPTDISEEEIYRIEENENYLNQVLKDATEWEEFIQ